MFVIDLNLGPSVNNTEVAVESITLSHPCAAIETVAVAARVDDVESGGAFAGGREIAHVSSVEPRGNEQGVFFPGADCASSHVLRIFHAMHCQIGLRAQHVSEA